MVKALVVFLTLRSKLFISTSTDMVLNVSGWPFKMFTVTRRSSLKPVFAYYVEASSSKAVALILRSSFLKTTRTVRKARKLFTYTLLRQSQVISLLVCNLFTRLPSFQVSGPFLRLESFELLCPGLMLFESSFLT